MSPRWRRVITGVTGLVALLAIGAALMTHQSRKPPVYEIEKWPLSPVDGPVVENPAPDPRVPTMELVAEPVLTVGRLGRHRDSVVFSADTADELWAVRDAVLTSSGRLIVINPSNEIRIFDAAGRSERVLARDGEGPGEVRTASRLHLLEGDTLLVWDGRLRRLTTFDALGRVTRTTALPGWDAPQCCFADGAMLTRWRDGNHRKYLFESHRRERDHERWGVASNTTGSTAAASPVLTVLGSDPPVRIGPMGGGMELTYTGPRPFARRAYLMPAGNDIIHGFTEGVEYHVYSRAGELRRVVRVALPSDSVTERHVANARRTFMPDRPRRDRVPYSTLLKHFGEAFDTLTFPTVLPGYDRLLTEADGTVWLRRYIPPGDTIPQFWMRFDSTGHLTGTLRVPERHAVVRFQQGFAIIRSPEDADGFVALHVHRIEPGVTSADRRPGIVPESPRDDAP